MAKSSNKYQISVVAPVFNEGFVLVDFVDKVKEEVQSLCSKWEIVLVDDGSSQETREILSELSKSERRVKVITFIRNFGQHAAIEAGIDFAQGSFIFVMDSDLQDSPSDLKRLLTKAESGFDIVYARRTGLKVSLHYRVLRNLFYRFLKFVSGIEFDSSIGNFCVFHSRVKEPLRLVSGSIPFFPAAAQWLGLRQTTVEVERGIRGEGSKAKYSLRKRYSLAVTAISTTSTRPLRFSIGLGVLIYFFAFLVGVSALIYAQLNGTAVSGWSSIVTLLLILFGTQSLILGIMGVYLSHISENSRSLPRFIIGEISS